MLNPIRWIAPLLLIAPALAQAGPVSIHGPETRFLCEANVDPSTTFKLGKDTEFEIGFQITKSKQVLIAPTRKLEGHDFTYQGVVGGKPSGNSTDYVAEVKSPEVLELYTEWFGQGGAITRDLKVTVDLKAGTLVESFREEIFPFTWIKTERWRHQLNLRNCRVVASPADSAGQEKL